MFENIVFTNVYFELYTFVNMKIDLKSYHSFKEILVNGRYVTLADLETFILKSGHKHFKIEGYSVNGNPVYSTTMGSGPIKVLIWSQMHGNESTSTKAVLDIFNFFTANHSFASDLLKHCTLKIIPILNPDGAKAYQRFNANMVDLNRDAQKKSQPESQILHQIFSEYQPQFCFNLHGQRTIFGTGYGNTPATLSFLSPSVNAGRTINKTRAQAMGIISHIFNDLKTVLPDAIGRYDDEFNINCVGDTFQNAGVPTVLFEAGHYPKDYDRDITRFYFFNAIISGLYHISFSDLSIDLTQTYLKIPENKKCLVDVLIKNVKHFRFKNKLGFLHIQFEEVLVHNQIKFKPKVINLCQSNIMRGHLEIDACGQEVLNQDKKNIKLQDEIDFVFIKNQKYLINP